jgi:maltose O-acetyltransferase
MNETSTIPQTRVNGRKRQMPPSVIDESLLPPIGMQDMEYRKGLRPLLSYEAWAWYQAMFYWIPGRVGWLIRRAAYRPFFQRAGEGWHIGEYASIQRVSSFQIGHKVAIGRFSVINAIGGVIIGDYSGMGPFCQINTAHHNFLKEKFSGGVPYEEQPRLLETAPVVIGKAVWLGAGVTVLPGVRIPGPATIVAAGAVVNDDLPPYSMAAGVPAKVKWQSSKEEMEAGEGPYAIASLEDRMKMKMYMQMKRQAEQAQKDAELAQKTTEQAQKSAEQAEPGINGQAKQAEQSKG